MKPQKEKIHTRLATFILPFVYTVIILVASLVIYLYSNGYRIDFTKQEITKTGVLGIESDPFNAQVIIGGQAQGRTPKSTSLQIGQYAVTIQKDGYHDWTKEVNIFESKSTLIFPWLIKTDNSPTTVWTSESNFEKYWVDENRNHVIFLLQNTDSAYALWEYSINPPLWDFSDNPSTFLQLNTNDIEITVSPNGENILLKIKTSEQNQYYIVSTQTSSSIDTLSPIGIENLDGYQISWSEDNKYLILESASQILAYNIKNSAVLTLITKTDSAEYIWTTDEEGFFYNAEPEAAEGVYSYRLKQTAIENGVSKYITDKFYFQKTDTYINEYRTNGFSSQEFTSSPESTLSAGALQSITVDQDALGVYMRTSLAAYWYNIETQKFLAVSVYPSQLVEISPENEKLVYNDNQEIGIFTFDREEGDPLTSIGSKGVGNIDQSKATDIDWISNGEYLIYTQDSSVYICDIDGENNIEILNDTIITAIAKASRDAILVLKEDDNSKLVITRYTIH